MEDCFVLQLSNRTFKDFYLCFCGHAKCGKLHSFGPAVRANYIIHYVLSGKGYCTGAFGCYDAEDGWMADLQGDSSVFAGADHYADRKIRRARRTSGI